MLAIDTFEVVAALGLPAVLWLFLFLVAWEDPDIGRAAGFGRRTFWLLVPIGLLASSLGDLPFFLWDANLVTINLAGGLFPLVLSMLMLRSLLGGAVRAVGALLGAFAVETGAMFAAVVAFPTGPVGGILVVLCAIVAPVTVEALTPTPTGPGGTSTARPSVPLAVASMALVLTFFSTAAVPNVGIVSQFPFYLIAPVVAGAVSVPLAVRVLHRSPAFGLSLAYASTTLGVLVGADVLRQPPLYGSGNPSVLSIGGAGLLDLLYLSGLIAASVAYPISRYLDRGGRPVPPNVGARTPRGYLRVAVDLGEAGRIDESIRASATAGRAAADRARSLLGLPEGPAHEPWYGLGVAPWVGADQANLDAIAARPAADLREAGRAYRTARALVRLGEQVGRRRFAPPVRRLYAATIDAALTAGATISLTCLVAMVVGPSLLQNEELVFLLGVVIGFASWSYAYLALAEATFGRTVGKEIAGLSVRSRGLGPIGLRAALLRNVPKLAPLALLGVGVAILPIALLVALTGAVGPLGVPTALVLVIVVLGVEIEAFVGLLVCLGIGWAAVEISRERQRVGDYLAGSFVVSRRAPS